MKNKVKNIFFAIGILIFSSSCDNFLDVHPKGEVLDKDLLTDQKGFENALYGVYATLRSTELYGRNLSYYNLDIMAQYFFCFGNTFVTELLKFNYKHSDIEESFYKVWNSMYTNISNVNNVLDNLEHESPQSLKYYNIYKGEALGLRAFMHFDLLRIFSKQITLDKDTPGIPYRTHFSLDATEILKAEKVYTCIINDLRNAEKLLADEKLYSSATDKDNFLKDQQIHFNLQAVQATLARVYLTQNNLDSALYYACEVIQEQQQTLLEKAEISEDIAGILSQKETIFGIYSKYFYDTTLADLYKDDNFTSLDPRYNIRTIYQKNRVGNDYRWDSWFYTTNPDYLRLSKFLDKYVLNNIEYNRPAWQIRGINLIRLPEMYYIASECLLKQGNYPKALAYFNDILRSRGLTPLDERNPKETLSLERITDERYKEFIGEGQTFFNMKRLNLDIENTEGIIVPAGKNIYVIDIPEQEFDYRK